MSHAVVVSWPLATIQRRHNENHINARLAANHMIIVIHSTGKRNFKEIFHTSMSSGHNFHGLIQRLKHNTIVTAASRQIETKVTEKEKRKRLDKTMYCTYIPYNLQLPGKVQDSLRI
jgi:hypothetical protein